MRTDSQNRPIDRILRIWSLPVIFLVLLSACGKRERDDVVQSGQRAFDSARSAIGVAYGSAMDSASKLTQRSPIKSLEEAKAKALAVQKQFEGFQNLVDEDKKKLDAVRKQIDRLDAAIKLNDLQLQWEDTIQRATGAKKDLEQYRANLRNSNPAFRTLDDRVMAAERAYTEASNRVSAPPTPKPSK